MSQSSVLFERRDQIARVTLNRPEVLNSFDQGMFTRFVEVIGEIEADRSLRALLLTGAGRGFCAGQDIAGGVPQGDYGDHMEKGWHPTVRGLRNLAIPILCAVNGVAAGAGANVALACDFVIAAEEASFVQAFINIGLVPDSGGTSIVPRLVGTARATQLLMLGEKISAKQAVEWGLIYRAVPLASLEAEAWALATRLAAMPTLALGMTKQLINTAFTNTFAQQLSAEAERQTIAGRSRDHQEGVAAFREKRKPVFEGR
jgi:2-(1,2-epoxy-1,2-dihydrophenyl)acetyl-CoA isomerase